LGATLTVRFSLPGLARNRHPVPPICAGFSNRMG
jgi:hypothetical protein